MSSSSSKDVPVFSSTLDELLYWKNKSQQLKEENQQLKEEVRQLKSKKSFSCVSADDGEETNLKDPVKKIRYEEMDPFKFFPQHCQNIILNHLNEMDIYNMTKVSEYWKLIVESDKKAAEKLEEAVTLRVKSMANRDKLMERNTIEYVHAELSTDAFDIACLCKYAATLETAEVDSTYYDYARRMSNAADFTQHIAQKFLRLRKLDVCFYEPELICWLSGCLFPALTKLRLSFLRNYRIKYDELMIDYGVVMNRLYKSIPNLKYLNMKGDMVNELLIPHTNAPFRLQSLGLDYFCEHLIIHHARTLTGISTVRLSMRELDVTLKNSSKLQTLQIGLLSNEETEMNQPLFIHAGVTKLELLSFSTSELIPIIKSLPSLETLILHEDLTLSHLQFMAHNHRYLKVIKCYGVEENLMEAYEKLKHDENAAINKDIKINIR